MEGWLRAQRLDKQLHLASNSHYHLEQTSPELFVLKAFVSGGTDQELGDSQL